MQTDVTIWAAFLAGILSFLSPCVLPLVPPYLCFITGQSLDDLAGDARDDKALTREVMGAAIAFVLGFATVFTALGATASAIGTLLREHMLLLAQVAGVLIILMGLHFIGLFKFALFHREARYHHEVKPAGLIGSYFVGLAFAFGWTPCIGPVLATILAVAASEAQVARGAGLLAIYSLGLGVPFLGAALMVRQFLHFLSRFRRHLGLVEKLTGVALVVTGVAFLTGAMQNFSYWLIETFPGLASFG